MTQTTIILDRETVNDSAQDHAAWVWQGSDLNPGPYGSWPFTETRGAGLRRSAEERERYPGLLPLSLQSAVRTGDPESLLGHHCLTCEIGLKAPVSPPHRVVVKFKQA